jgi:hypothetical protein
VRVFLQKFTLNGAIGSGVTNGIPLRLSTFLTVSTANDIQTLKGNTTVAVLEQLPKELKTGKFHFGCKVTQGDGVRAVLFCGNIGLPEDGIGP